MGEGELMVGVGNLNGGLGVGQRHGDDLIRLQVGAGEELEEIGTAGDVFLGSGNSGGRVFRLGGEALDEPRFSAAKVEGQGVGWVLGGAGGIDEGALELAGFYAAAEGDGVDGVRAEVSHGSEAAAGEHIGQSSVEGGGGPVCRERPDGLGEVDVRVPEAGGDGALVAGQEGGAGRRGEARANGGDAAITDEDGGVVKRRKIRREIDGGVCEEGRLLREAERRVRVAERQKHEED